MRASCQLYVTLARVCPLVNGVGLCAISVVSFFVLVSLFRFKGSNVCVGFQNGVRAILYSGVEEVDDARLARHLSFVDRVARRGDGACRDVTPVITNEVGRSAVAFAAGRNVNDLRLDRRVSFARDQDAMFRSVFTDRITRYANETRVEGDVAQDVFRRVVNRDRRHVFFAVRRAILAGRDRTIGVEICRGDRIYLAAFRGIRGVARVLLGQFKIVNGVANEFTVGFLRVLCARTFRRFKGGGASSEVRAISDRTRVDFPSDFRIRRVGYWGAIGVFLVMDGVFAVETRVVCVYGIGLFDFNGAGRFITFNYVRGFAVFIGRFRHVPLLKVIQDYRGSASADTFRHRNRLDYQDEDGVGVCCVPTRTRGNTCCRIFRRFTKSAYVATCCSFVAYEFTYSAGRHDVHQYRFRGIGQIRSLTYASTGHSTSSESEFS